MEALAAPGDYILTRPVKKPVWPISGPSGRIRVELEFPESSAFRHFRSSESDACASMRDFRTHPVPVNTAAATSDSGGKSMLSL